MRPSPRPDQTDQDQGQDYKTKIKTKTSCVEPLPSKCMSLSPHVHTAVRLLMFTSQLLQKRSQENAVSNINSLRPDQDQHNKPKTKNKACQTKTKTKIIFCWSETSLVGLIRPKSQTASVVHCVA